MISPAAEYKVGMRIDKTRGDKHTFSINRFNIGRV